MARTKFNKRAVRESDGGIVAGATVTFYNQASGLPVAVYDADEGGSSLGSSVLSEADGSIPVFMEPGVYRITVESGGELIADYTYEAVFNTAVAGTNQEIRTSIIGTGAEQKYASMAAFLAAQPETDSIEVISFTAGAGRGGSRWRKTGETVSSTSVANPSAGTLGTAANNNAGYAWTSEADGVEWYMSKPDGHYNAEAFGIISEYNAGSGAPDNYQALTDAIAVAHANELPLFVPGGDYMVSDEILLPHDFEFFGAGAKVTTFYPRVNFPFGAVGAGEEPKYVFKDLMNPGVPTPDNNFFCVRRDFGIRNPGANHVGCYWARPGGGSEYTNLYLSDAYGESCLRVSAVTAGEGGSGGAAVACEFNNIWLANNRGAGNSKVKNGLEMTSCYSIVFNNLICDYQSNEIDYTTSDTDGYGIRMSGCVGCVFNGLNAEGNAKPVYMTNSQGTVFNGGAFYRVGLGSSPSTDPDFIFTVESAATNMPTIINMFRGQGYNPANSGGIAKIRAGASLTIVERSGYFSYFNNNRLNAHDAYLTNCEFKGQAVNFTANRHYFNNQTVNSNFRPLAGTLAHVTLTSGVGSFVDVAFRGAGAIVIVVRREDGSSGYAHVKTGIAIIATDAGAWVETSDLFTSATYDIITTITASANNLRINYDAPAATSIMEVYFIGSTLTGVVTN